jgi:heme-degrading monooxygenase HmoA
MSNDNLSWCEALRLPHNNQGQSILHVIRQIQAGHYGLPRRGKGHPNFNAPGEDMIAIIFEVVPAEGRRQEYLDIAADLRRELEKIDGFISIERFASLSSAGKILSLSFFRDEAAVEAWRNLEAHRLAQARGRGGIFADYRLRVAGVMRDYGMFERDQAPSDSRRKHGA